MTNRALTVADLCKRYSVTPNTVLAWIRSGSLRAVNVARSASKRRPTWRITAEALAEFENARTPKPPTTATRKPCRKLPERPGFIKFY